MKKYEVRIVFKGTYTRKKPLSKSQEGIVNDANKDIDSLIKRVHRIMGDE